MHLTLSCARCPRLLLTDTDLVLAVLPEYERPTSAHHQPICPRIKPRGVTVAFCQCGASPTLAAWDPQVYCLVCTASCRLCHLITRGCSCGGTPYLLMPSAGLKAKLDIADRHKFCAYPIPNPTPFHTSLLYGRDARYGPAVGPAALGLSTLH